MLDLAAAYLPDVQVSVMCWPTPPGLRVLDRAAAIGATPLALPHPRHPSFTDTIVRLLQEHPADVFHAHVGTGREDFDGAREALGLRSDQPVVMTIGRLTVMKGQRYLLESVPRLADRFAGLAVLVLGQGHLQPELEHQAAALGVQDCVRLLGHRSDARMLLDAADVFVLPSRHEGMPLAALEAMEAMEAGLPVVATRVIGSAEVVADGRTGLLVPPQDADALGEALATLLADPDLRRRYGAAGQRRYLEQFTHKRMAEQTVAVYEQALGPVGQQQPAEARG